MDTNKKFRIGVAILVHMLYHMNLLATAIGMNITYNPPLS